MIETIETGEPVMREIEIMSGEHKLAGRLFHPTGKPKAVVIINAATGVRQNYYEPFAKWLATEKNLACVTYDYRALGASLRGRLSRSPATLGDWCVHDVTAARDHVWSLLPGVPIWHLGHSIGGMGLPFQDGVTQLERIITVASGPVHLRDHPWPYRAVASAFWYGPPLFMAKALGYLPGRMLGLGPDLPKGVYLQWRKWCTSTGFFSSDIGRALPYPDWNGLRCPVKVVAASDDDLVPPKAVWRIMELYRQAKKEQLTLRPENYGIAKIGHVGMFAKENAACWEDIIA